MALTVDWPSGVITILQSDTSLLTNISGTLYELDTDEVRLQLKNLEDGEEGILWPTTHTHNTTVTISGVTYVRTIEIINGYSITFTPDSQWSVLMDGATNNNYHDVEAGILNQNQVQVIAQNSAGNTLSETGVSGLTTAEAQDLADIRKGMFNRVHTDPDTGLLTIYDDDNSTILYQGNIYEDVLALQAYRSQGLERRNKLTRTP